MGDGTADGQSRLEGDRHERQRQTRLVISCQAHTTRPVGRDSATTEAIPGNYDLLPDTVINTWITFATLNPTSGPRGPRGIVTATHSHSTQPPL